MATVVLGRPAADSIAINIRPSTSLEGFIEYGKENLSSSQRTAKQSFPAQASTSVELRGLEANSRYVYRLNYQDTKNDTFKQGPEYSFHTQRSPGSTFSFQVQGDSHPERNPKQNLPAMYEQTLLAVAADRPDFYLAMGDDFSVDTLNDVSPASVEQVYLQQLPYLGLAAHSSPIFLVNGNHEQAAKYLLDGTPDNVAIWAQNSRNRHFPQPAPDDFYGGNPEPVEHIGLLRNYYAWTWGDALFVVIDPYWHSEVPVDGAFQSRGKSRESWKKTLGDTQYRWLAETLEQSQASFKFVFAHHVSGGGRGGAKLAGLYEWGGHNQKGQWEFDRYRPGWKLPIHPLMAKNGVTIFFQGHDHVFATEKLDGVVYQTLPEPADPNYALYFEEAFAGTVLPNSGRVRVTVSPDKVDVEYVATVLPSDENTARQDGAVLHRYSIPARSGKTGTMP
ncbi:MAG: metallophosphoesterase family protein [Xanthomonadales bacterium]|nr:metallophosphoesterase family protein [Xanthomonadales bacterium]